LSPEGSVSLSFDTTQRVTLPMQRCRRCKADKEAPERARSHNRAEVSPWHQLAQNCYLRLVRTVRSRDARTDAQRGVKGAYQAQKLPSQPCISAADARPHKCETPRASAGFRLCALQDSNLWPLAPEGVAHRPNSARCPMVARGAHRADADADACATKGGGNRRPIDVVLVGVGPDGEGGRERRRIGAAACNSRAASTAHTDGLVEVVGYRRCHGDSTRMTVLDGEAGVGTLCMESATRL
jgi:hypothetical protein